MTSARITVSIDGLTAWLIDRVAEYTDRTPESVTPSVPFSDFGLDSVYALALCGDLEDHLGLVLEPTLIWDHPTIDALVAHLAEAAAHRDAGARGSAA